MATRSITFKYSYDYGNDILSDGLCTIWFNTTSDWGNISVDEKRGVNSISLPENALIQLHEELGRILRIKNEPID